MVPWVAFARDANVQPHLIHGVLSPNSISISSAVSAGLTYVPNTQTETSQITEHATCVPIGCIYVMHMMRPG